jgi:hypothetical protein
VTKRGGGTAACRAKDIYVYIYIYICKKDFWRGKPRFRHRALSSLVRLQTEGLLEIEEKTKRPSKSSGTNQKTIPNGWKNIVGTAWAPKRAKWVIWFKPPEPR